MEKQDIEEFREAIQRMSDEDGEEKRQSTQVDDREKLLEEYQQQASQLEKEKEALKMENSLFLSSVNNEVESSRTDVVDESETLPDNDQHCDDLSSIFSEDEEDLRSLVEGSDTIRKALQNLRKERDFWVADTASETSDDGDTSVSTRSLRDASADRIQISKLLAEKEFLELKLSQVANEKKDTETKLKYMEKEKGENRKRQDKHSVNTRLHQSEPIRHSPHTENKKQSSKHGDHKKSKDSQKQHTHRHRDHSTGTGMSNAELLQFLHSRSISPQLVKGYEDDIALLATENAKLGEIIDHLHIHPEEEQSPRTDPMAAFMEAYEHRVPQEDYMRLQSEKMRLEHLVREKDRQIKDRERMFEETKFEFEDEMKLLKDALKRMEEKMREKTREVNEYEIQIIELKTSFEEQLVNIESELELIIDQKIRLEEVNVTIVENNKQCQKEIEHLKSSLSKLQAREKDIERKYGKDLKMLEEKFNNENREKNQLSGNLEGLMTDLMMLKSKLLEDGSRTARMRQGFEKERLNLAGEDLDVNPRFTNLTLHLKSRSPNENAGQPSTDSMMETQLTNQEAVVMETNEFNLNMQQVEQRDISEYTILIQQQKDMIKMLEKANLELNAKLQNSQQQKRLSDVSILHCDIIQDPSQTHKNVSPEPDIQINGQSNQLVVGVPDDRSATQGEVTQDQQNVRNTSPSPRQSSALQHEMNELEQENMYLKNKLEDLGKEKMKRRELEEKNEELQEEISQMTRKRTELQKKQDHMSNEIDEMNDKVEELEKCNAKLSKEADQLMNRIKEMEESFNEEKANLTFQFEKERGRMEKELNRAFEQEQERFKEMEEEVEKLQDEINLLTRQNKDLKNKCNREMGNARDIDEKESEEEMEKLRDEIASLIKQNKDTKNEYNKEIENLKRQHEEELGNLSQLQGDGNENLDHLRTVEQQWKTKLEITIQKYEDQLKRLGKEKEELLNRSEVPQDTMRMSEQSTQSDFTQIIISERPIEDQDLFPTVCQVNVVENELVTKDAHVFTPSYIIESEVPLEDNIGDESQPEDTKPTNKKTSAQLITPSTTSEVPLDDQMANEDQETVGLAKIMKIDDYVPNNDQESLAEMVNDGVKARVLTPSYSITEIPLEDEPENDIPRISAERDTVEMPAKQPKVSDTIVDVQRIPIDADRREVEYTSSVPNLQIQVELERDERRERSFQDDEKINQLENQRTQLQNALNQKQNEILSLTQKLAQLEQHLIGKNREIASLQDKEGNGNVIIQNKIDETSRYYQDLLEKLKATLQGEKRELEDRLNKESEEMQKLMKEEFQKSLSSKSGILENRIHELVADKVKNYKEQIQKLEVLLKKEKEKIKQFENGDDERTKRIEREKKVLRVTIQALCKELNKAKQDRKDMKKEYKRSKAELKNAAEEERKNFEESLERAKDVQKLKIEEELRNKYIIDVEKYEEKLEHMNAEIGQYETKIDEMVIKFKEEKFKLESDLQDSLFELETMKEAETEFRISLEDEYKRKLRSEKQNIETTLESLRQEITRLRENRQQLESQLQQNAHYKPEKDSGCTTLTQSSENILNNKEIFNRIENEYQQQLQREKEYYESKILDLENDYDSLTNEISRLKTKYRQDRMMMKSEFEKEKAFLEDRFEREKRDLQASIHLRLQNMRDPRMSQNIPRSIRLQSEIGMLQQKISRLEDLSPRIIGMAQQHSALYSGQSSLHFQSSHQGSTLQVPGMQHGVQYAMNNEMSNYSQSVDASPRYSATNISSQEIIEEDPNDDQETTDNTLAHSNEVMRDNSTCVVDNSIEGEYHATNEEMSSDRQDIDNAPLCVDNESR